jgi:hypothetical protein
LKGFVLGTAGHVDHGKTSLVRALTGIETDRWKEERERGLTIDIGFVIGRRDGIGDPVHEIPDHALTYHPDVRKFRIPLDSGERPPRLDVAHLAAEWQHGEG